MRPVRFRTRSMIIAVVGLAILAAFLRPDSPKDPAFLSVASCAVIVGVLVELLIRAISLLHLPLSGLDPSEDQSSNMVAESDQSRRAARVQVKNGMNPPIAADRALRACALGTCRSNRDVTARNPSSPHCAGPLWDRDLDG